MQTNTSLIKCYAIYIALSILLTASLFISTLAQANHFTQRADVQAFINEMVITHQFNHQELESWFSKAEIQNNVLEAIQNPYEAKPWYVYREFFVTPTRIDSGVKFLKQNKEILARAEDKYGVPPHIIVAIIGVETNYGSNQGSFSVFDTLSTLAFEYPRRAEFFRKELVQFLLLTRENSIDPFSVYGSYAGAIGKPQFIPSSYRHYAVDFSNTGQIDLRNDVEDAIGSVANYLSEHGWQAGAPIAIPAQVSGQNYKTLDYKKLSTIIPAGKLQQYNVTPDYDLPSDQMVNLIELDGANGTEVWVGLNNFYTITRYNISRLYAMAVFELAEEIAKQDSANATV